MWNKVRLKFKISCLLDFCNGRKNRCTCVCTNKMTNLNLCCIKIVIKSSGSSHLKVMTNSFVHCTFFSLYLFPSRLTFYLTSSLSDSCIFFLSFLKHTLDRGCYGMCVMYKTIVTLLLFWFMTQLLLFLYFYFIWKCFRCYCLFSYKYETLNSGGLVVNIHLGFPKRRAPNLTTWTWFRDF